jgi:hypothetical protein
MQKNVETRSTYDAATHPNGRYTYLMMATYLNPCLLMMNVSSPTNLCHLTNWKKGKAVPVTGREGP